MADHTGSHDNMTLARHWIKDCLDNHAICASGSRQGQSDFVPARLIDIQDPDRPFLVTAATEATATKYVALSYVWGSGKRFTTTRANFRDHQRRIPPESSPKTFTDAFRVTRGLGYKYIWIDALCIIQDDAGEGGDLQREIANMGAIYRYATLTIFAAGAPNASAGLFQRRDPNLYRPCVISVGTVLTDEDEDGAVFEKEEELTLATVVTGPNHLKARGWVLQEEVLSTRALCFGKQVNWQCAAAEASEAWPAPRPRKKTALTHGRASCEDKLKLWLYAAAQMREEAPRDDDWFRWNQYDAWYAVIEEYSIKNLSFVSDQLRALAGLSELFRQAHRATYAAGLWREDMQIGLAWYVASNDTRPVKGAAEGQMPSWSWVSVGMVRLKFRSWDAFSEHLVAEGAEILEVACSKPSRGVVDGTLRLRTRVKKLRLCWSAEYVTKRTEFSYGAYSGPETATMTKKEHPRFPALILGLGATREFIGEAALDRPPRVGSGTGTETETGTGNTDPFRAPGREAIQCECEVWCALLHVQKASNYLRFTALVLDQDRTKPTGYRYHRVGLLFLDSHRIKDTSFLEWDTREIDIL